MRDSCIGVFENPAIVLGIEQSFVVAEARACGLVTQSGVLGRQAFATFGTTAIQYMTTTFGRHSSAKTVGALALQYAGLKCSFHDEIPWCTE